MITSGKQQCLHSVGWAGNFTAAMHSSHLDDLVILSVRRLAKLPLSLGSYLLKEDRPAAELIDLSLKVIFYRRATACWHNGQLGHV